MRENTGEKARRREKELRGRPRIVKYERGERSNNMVVEC